MTQQTHTLGIPAGNWESRVVTGSCATRIYAERRVIAELPYHAGFPNAVLAEAIKAIPKMLPAWNSYASNCGPNAVAAAESDLLGEALAALKHARESLANAIEVGWEMATPEDIAAHVAIKPIDAVLAKAKGDD